MTNDIETLPTALYVKIDDGLAGPRRLGRPPVLTASELVCLALAQSRLGLHLRDALVPVRVAMMPVLRPLYRLAGA
ncbi:hypothetical protein QF035_010311 [Streptomyces umbrinus]|uniref:Transposase n=1 Tax=Streptomyces umbrinus TaxID=67370 RepID=A0ABU0TA90_9ACTN|nr:hypothetical protein [Streptomyces umbrinus]MDQ1032729.1 hypothetical protein [Streptomyces umbrinus]